MLRVVLTVPGVQEQVAVHGDAEIVTPVQIAVPLSLKVTVPARPAVAVSVTAVPNVAVVAFEGSATETVVLPRAAPSWVLKEFVEPVFAVFTCAVAVAPALSPVTVTDPLVLEIDPAEVEIVHV